MSIESNLRVFIPNLLISCISRILVLLCRVIYYITKLNFYIIKLRSSYLRQNLLIVESGEAGWKLIEYEELLVSAVEYLGEANVSKFIVTHDCNYLKEVVKELRKRNPTHYVYDPRTGSQHWISGLCESIALVSLFAWYGVVPIARLSDMPERRWRIQCAIVTSQSGICTSLMLPPQMKVIFPHRRLIGPMMMAISNETVVGLDHQRKERPLNPKPRVVFTGAMYEPRATFMRSLQKILDLRGIELILETRSIEEPRDSNKAYWERLLAADIVVTTSDLSIGLGAESMNIPHFIYRYSEVLASGALLIAPSVPGIEKYFKQGQHFVKFSSIDEAADAIEFYYKSNLDRKEIAKLGSLRLQQLTQTQTYWREIDFALGVEGFI